MISFDANTNLNTASATSLTYSHTMGAGANGGLFVVVGFGGSDDVTGVTYAGVSMTKIFASTYTDTGGYHWNIYFLAAPATGANNVVISRTSSNSIRSSSASYLGISQTIPSGTQAVTYSNTASGNDGPTINIAVANSWMMAVGLNQTSVNPNATFNDTKRTSGFGSNPDILDSNGTLATGNTQIGMSYPGSDLHQFFGIAFAPYAAPSVNGNFLGLL